jgi:pectinesterase
MTKIIAKDGSGDFKSIQEAINSVAKNNQKLITFFIKRGIYKEKIFIDRPFVHLQGEDKEEVVLTYDDYAEKLMLDGDTYGTFRSYSLFVGANDCIVENVTIENSAGPGSKVGQALAVYADADRLIFRNCNLLGHQDTLFTGPLPPAPIQVGSFKGPREDAERVNGRQYYEKCFIRGDIDFIFGSATAYFYQCEIFSNNRNEEVNGYITAPSTPQGQAFGYVFKDCKLTSECQKETVYLSRPWREYAHVAFIDCEMEAHIKREGWDDWNKKEAHTKLRFEEYKNTGEGYRPDQRVCYSKRLTTQEVGYYSIENVLGGEDGWNPRK